MNDTSTRLKKECNKSMVCLAGYVCLITELGFNGNVVDCNDSWPRRSSVEQGLREDQLHSADFTYFRTPRPD